MTNRLNVDRLAQVLAEILSDKHGLTVTVEAVHRSEAPKRRGGAEATACLLYTSDAADE